MGTRRMNTLDLNQILENEEVKGISLTEAKRLFLRDVRGLAQHTQRWHRENLTALENVLRKQDIVIEDCRELTVSFLKEHFLFYMLEQIGLKVNTINGRIRSARGLIQFLYREGHVSRDYSADLPILKAEKVIIPTFSEEQIAKLLAQPNQKTYTGYRDFVMLLLLIETGIRISECVNIKLVDVKLRKGRFSSMGRERNNDSSLFKVGCASTFNATFPCVEVSIRTPFFAQ